MIKIKIHNINEILEREKNWLIAKVAPVLVDVEKKVEQEIIKQLEEVFLKRNIKASFVIEKD